MPVRANSRGAGRSQGDGAGLRTFLAGGAGTALLAATIVALLSTATFVGVNGLPFGGSDGDGDAVDLRRLPAGAPEAAAVAIAPAPEAVAALPAAASPVPAPPVDLATSPATGPVGGGTPPASGGAPPGGGTSPGDPGTATPPTPPPGGGTAPATQGGVLGGTVGDLDHTVASLGLDLRLDELTAELTAPLDRAVNRTLNGVGALVGNPSLGDQADSSVNGLTGALLGPDGLTDRLLRGRR